MFKLIESGMPEDPSYPPNLKQLGYFIDERSEIRTIKPPHNYYNFWISNNDRVNESFREAMHACINREISHRMVSLGMPPIYLPHLTTEKPTAEPSVPIFVTKREELKKLKRIIVVINDDFQDLGLWAYRIASKEGGVESGSVVSLAKAMQTNHLTFTADAEPVFPPTCPVSPQEENHDLKESLISKPGANKGPGSPIASKTPVSSTNNAPFKVPQDWRVPGLVFLNPGQLFYSHRLDKAMTKQSWDSQPLKSAIHPVPRIDPVFNKIEGNRTVYEHVKTSLEKILNNPDWVAPDANIYIIGIGNGGDAVLRVLDHQWPLYKDRVAAIALTDPTPIQDPFEDHDFVAFLRHRARALVPSSEPFSTPIAVPAETDHPKEAELLTRTANFPAAPWLEQIPDVSSQDPIASLISHASDTLVSSISQLAIESIAKAPTQPVRTMPQKSYEWGYHYFPILSSGERIFGEIIFPVAQHSILAWFETIASTPNYRNPLFVVPEPPPEGLEDAQVFDAKREAPKSVLEDATNKAEMDDSKA